MEFLEHRHALRARHRGDELVRGRLHLRRFRNRDGVDGDDVVLVVDRDRVELGGVHVRGERDAGVRFRADRLD